jgi:hypothetical protein
MWQGPEAERTIRVGDIPGLDETDDSELVWAASTRFVQELTEDEYAALVACTSPGDWAVVEETSAAPEGSIAASSSASASSQEASSSSKKSGKSSDE